jgi:hypothetical protein
VPNSLEAFVGRLEGRLEAIDGRLGGIEQKMVTIATCEARHEAVRALSVTVSGLEKIAGAAGGGYRALSVAGAILIALFGVGFGIYQATRPSHPPQVHYVTMPAPPAVVALAAPDAGRPSPLEPQPTGKPKRAR